MYTPGTETEVFLCQSQYPGHSDLSTCLFTVSALYPCSGTTPSRPSMETHSNHLPSSHTGLLGATGENSATKRGYRFIISNPPAGLSVSWESSFLAHSFSYSPKGGRIPHLRHLFKTLFHYPSLHKPTTSFFKKTEAQVRDSASLASNSPVSMYFIYSCK